MAAGELILAIDQGTTSSRAVVFDGQANIISMAQQEFPQHFPQDGWVEHDPEDIWASTLSVAREAVNEAEKTGAKVVAIGITNQRETSLVWDKVTGEAIYKAIVWQDRRTALVCQDLKAQELETEVQQRTGLLLDPYFSATKVAWILDNVPGARTRAQNNELAFGTVDTFLIWRLTGGRSHLSDITNASRTNLLNIHTGQWDERLLDIFSVPKQVLPRVLDCAADFGETDQEIFGRPIPILGVAGDQQAAAVGQCCFGPGAVKSTYGTGCFVLLNTGAQAVKSTKGLLTTVAFRHQGTTTYALEGSIFIAGAAVQWLRDGLKLIGSTAETEAMARNLPSNEGVYLVPAFTGMGAPYWDPGARGAIYGLTRATGAEHIARATLESVCFQTYDLLAAMAADAPAPVSLRVDGGMVANDWLMQFLADILSLNIDRPKVVETTAVGAFYWAALQAGLFESLEDIAKQWRCETTFTPTMPSSQRENNIKGWGRAVRRTLS